MLTASVQESDRQLCLLAGADDFTWKPIEFDVLYDKIANFFETLEHGTTVLGVSNPSLENLEYHLLDVAKGLEVWGDAEVFRKALMKMGRDYGNTAARLRVLCQDGQWQLAIELLHAFKGVAGNLGVRELPEIANSIETQIKAGEPASQTLLNELAAKTELMLQDLRQIETLNSPLQASDTVTNLETIGPLLEQLIGELESDAMNDDTIESLRHQLSPDNFEPIELLLESFEFKRAAEAAQELLTALKSANAAANKANAAVLPLLQQLIRSLEVSEIDDGALADLRFALDPQSNEELEIALESFEFQEAIVVAKKLMTQYENTYE